MSRPRRIEFRPDERTLAHLEAEQARTGASFAEIVRRALVPPTPPDYPGSRRNDDDPRLRSIRATYAPAEIERRAAPAVLVAPR
jgi:hypothetical protein